MGKGNTIPLQVGELPQGTQSLALLMDDLDTKGPFVHWMAWNIPSTQGPLTVTQTGSAVVSLNSASRPGYLPPCPPENSKRPHRYHVQVYALSVKQLDAKAPLSRSDFKKALIGTVLGKGEITGTVQR